jgi:hypothetical protein
MNYGTNNNLAFIDTCEESPTGRHLWKETDYRKCLSVYKCVYCGAIHRVDSSD